MLSIKDCRERSIVYNGLGNLYKYEPTKLLSNCQTSAGVESIYVSSRLRRARSDCIAHALDYRT